MKYLLTCFSRKKHRTPAVKDFCKERTFLLSSLSKLYAMAGWSSGYGVGPVFLIEKSSLLAQTTLSCFLPFIQFASAATLASGCDYVTMLKNEYKKRATLLCDGLN